MDRETPKERLLETCGVPASRQDPKHLQTLLQRAETSLVLAQKTQEETDNATGGSTRSSATDGIAAVIRTLNGR